MDKNTLLLGIGALSLWMLSNNKKSHKERYFIVGGQSVPESQLPSKGFVYVNGKWWHNTTIQQAAQQGNVSVPNTQQGLNPQADAIWGIIGGVLATSMQLIPLFKDLGKK